MKIGMPVEVILDDVTPRTKKLTVYHFYQNQKSML